MGRLRNLFQRSTPAKPSAKAPTPVGEIEELEEGWDDWNEEAPPSPTSDRRNPSRTPTGDRPPQVLQAELISQKDDVSLPSPYEEESSI